MSANDEIDQLYAVDPAEFTGLRKDLVAAAKKRGDADTAKLIAASRRPTAAAWVVNTLVRADDTARGRLADLAEQLRAAHASMDGPRIRELTTAQRKLVDELIKTAFRATGQSRPTAALRDDVVGTLQAAIADPDVAARLGTLVKAEQWSGFGDFGAVTAVAAAPKRQTSSTKSTSKKAQPERPTADLTAAAEERVAAAKGEAKKARQAHAEADEALAKQSAALVTARRRYEKLLETLGAAEDDVNTADAAQADAEQAARETSDRLDAANSALAEAESALTASKP